MGPRQTEWVSERVRITCLECHVQFNDAAGACPNCRTKPLSIWWRVIGWYWPLPLGIGLALQVLSQHAGPQRGGPGVARPPEMAVIGQFAAGVLVLSAAAALLLFLLDRLRMVLRRKNSLRRRHDGRR